MNRLFRLGRPSLQQNLPLSLRNLNDSSVTLSSLEKTCLLCKHLNIQSTVHVKNQSTLSTNPNVKVRRQRKKKKLKNYTDILFVTDNSSCHHKATVQKLTSNDLKLLANTNLNLSELYKLKELALKPHFRDEHTYHNLTIIEDLPSTSSGVQDIFANPGDDKNHVVSYNIPSTAPLSLDSVSVKNAIESHSSLPHIVDDVEESELDLERVPRVCSFQPEHIEEHTEIIEPEEAKEMKEAPIKNIQEQKHRDEISAKTLVAYIEVCNHLRNPQRGLAALNFHRNRTCRYVNKAFAPIKNINLYNALLSGFSHKGDFDKLSETLEIIEKENVELNVDSYVSIFECLGRINIKDSHLKQIRIFGKDALKKGITFDRMMNEGIFANNERELVLQAMRSYDPDYIPTYKKPEVFYKNHLVDKLNHESQLEPCKKEYVENGGLFKPDGLKRMIKKQIKLEEEGYVTIKSIESKGKSTEEIRFYRQALEEHYRIWEETATSAFHRDLATLQAQRCALNLEPFMRCIPVKDFIAIIVDEAKKIAQGSETYSPTVNMLYRDLGNKVYARYKVSRKQKTLVMDKVNKIHDIYCEKYAAYHEQLDVLPKEENFFNPRQHWQWIEHSMCDKGASLTLAHQEWVPATLQAIGKFLYRIVMHDLQVDVNSMRSSSKHKNFLPAFYTIFRTQCRQVKEEVKPHPVLSRLYRASIPETLTFPSYEVPMLCPPVPWISTRTGGYLISHCDVIRLPSQATSQKQRLAESDPAHLYPSLDALNQLASVPWKVNKKVLDVILDVFNKGGSAKLDVPEPPSSLSTPPSPTQEMDKTERYKLFRQKLQLRRKKAEMYSLWCDCLYRLSLANHYKNDIFWLPHNMDFRGRVYPIPPHLNHLGSDLARSMLVFAESRPLGPNGLDWLKIHLINLTGLKKRDPVSERLKFANENLELILDSADKPLTGKQWWAESDEPWQTLACCMEIADVIRSGDPENYRSHFPIHQDGSCNGLQHYASLGRDSAGAYSVNLTESKEPQDVYSAVVALVEEQRARDAENGIEIAKILDGFVKRKVIKQTVMTTVYGVTRFGARLQIARQLKDIDNFPKDSVWAASSYLTARTFDSLRTMFTSTKEIQDWFTECARLISAVGCQHVEWVTPLGLPIVQPYFKFKKMPSTSVYGSFPMDKYEKPNVMKQKNAFPPNFVHSLDSCHMMLTSLHCERANITFVSVHDCYWTHPSTVHIMNKICREQFVSLHSEPILENLSLFLSDKYSYGDCDFTGDGSVADLTKKKLNRILRQLPKTGDFDIKQVLNSVYFFS